MTTPVVERARAVASTVTDPELPMLTLVDLGVLRGVDDDGAGGVVVTITPTYTGCPAMATMRADLLVALRRAGLEAEVRTSLSPAWSTDWITDRGRAALAEHGVAPPTGRAATGPVTLTLLASRPSPDCPRCGAATTRELSRFGATACTSLHVCRACDETFDHVKAI